MYTVQKAGVGRVGVREMRRVREEMPSAYPDPRKAAKGTAAV